MTATERYAYLTTDGRCFARGTAEEVCETLRATSWATEGTLADWIRSAADRATRQTGCSVSDRDPEKFIEGLIKAGLLVRVMLC